MVEMTNFDEIEKEQEQKTESDKSLTSQTAKVPEVATEKRTAESVIEAQRQYLSVSKKAGAYKFYIRIWGISIPS